MKRLSVLLILFLGINLVLAQGINSNANVNSQASVNTNMGQQIQTQVQTQLQEGNYVDGSGNRFEIKKQIMNENKEQLRLQVGGISARVRGNLTQNVKGNNTELRFHMSNGQNAEVMIMPNVASETALQQLRLRVCNESNNCTIELKAVGQGNQTKAAYQVQAEKQYKVFGLFRARARVNAEVDAETGEVINTNKPWWVAISSEVSE